MKQVLQAQLLQRKTALTYTVDLNSEEYGVGFRKGSAMADALNEFFAQANANGFTQVVAEQYGVQAAIIK